jgi:enoyl-CoA hydratase
MAYQNLLIENRGPVALLTINRPKALNSLDSSVLDELIAAFAALESDDAVRAVVMTGAGEKAFIAGADIAEMSELTVQQASVFSRKGQGLVNFIGRMTKPVVAAVNGFALGGGLEMALACDFAYASENAKVGLPEVTLGIMPGFGGTQKLARSIGPARASELIFTGKMLNAAEAKEWGIVNAVLPLAELVDKAVDTASKMAANSRLGIAYAKDALKRGLDMSEADGINLEAVGFGALFASADQREGMKAFLEKRKPAFTGA